MPIGSQRLKPLLSDDEKTKLSMLLAEAKSRGINLPPDMFWKEKIKWKTDESGYFIAGDDRNYTPTESQQGFIKSRARFSGFFGSRGAGKTSAGTQKALLKIQEGQNGAILNPDFENFKISTWPEFRSWIPWDNVVPAHQYRKDPEWQPYQPFVLTFVNGVNVICKGLKDPDSARGPNINWLWYDEAGRDITGESWRIAVASVRVGIMPQAWITTTPNVKAPWVRKFFINQEIPEEAREEFKKEGLNRELIETFFGSIYDNRGNLDPGFFASMLAAYPSGWLRQQEIFGQFVDEGGVLGDRAWFNGKIVPETPFDVYRRIRYYDLAATEKKLSGTKKNDPDETVGTLMSMSNDKPDPQFCVEHQVHGFWKWDDIKAAITDTAREDGFGVRIIVEQEPGSGGKNQIAELDSHVKQQIPGHPGVSGYRPDSDRVIAANFWFADAAAGRVYMVTGEWNKEMLDQLDIFPGSTSHTHDDRITSISGARINLAPPKKWKAIQFMHL